MLHLKHSPDAEIKMTDGSWAKVSDALVDGWRFDGATLMAERAVAAHIGDECGFSVADDRCIDGCDSHTWDDLPPGYTAECQGAGADACVGREADDKYDGQQVGECAVSTPAEVAVAYVEENCRGCTIYRNFTEPEFKCATDDDVCHMCYDSNVKSDAFSICVCCPSR